MLLLSPSTSIVPNSYRVSVPFMTATMSRATVPEVNAEVISWYDAGLRMTSAADPTEKLEVVPVPDTPTAEVTDAPPPLKSSINDAVRGLRPAYVWNPVGLTVDGLPEQAKPFKDQFVPQYLTAVPGYLDGSMQGDVGFDPWALAALANPTPDTLPGLVWANDRKARLDAMTPAEQKKSVDWMREAELKHGRLAMLAAAGWPMAELISGPLGLLSSTNGRAPSLFNGALLDHALILVAVTGGLAYVESQRKDGVGKRVITYGEAQAGDWGFDPLERYTKYFPTKDMQLAEIKHGRTAMMAITGFSLQEFLWGQPVIEQTPWFFGH